MRNNIEGLIYHSLSRFLLRTFSIPVVGKYALKFVLRIEGGVFHSGTLRHILERRHGVRVGAYSYGPCLSFGEFPAGVTIGRYVSIAPGVKVFLRNHPSDRLSLHPFFYNRTLGYVPKDTIETGTLEIGHDAWIGERAIITPSCKRIGIGSIVGAGAVVTKDVPDFAICAGNPAKIIRYRFEETTRQMILESRWWEKNIDDLLPNMSYMTSSLCNAPQNHPILSKFPGSRLPD